MIQSCDEAIQAANKAIAHSETRIGAQVSIPYQHELLSC